MVDSIKHVYDAAGRIEFEAAASRWRPPRSPAARGQLSVLFTDATSGRTTYPACRSPTVGASRGRQQAVTLDFNRAVNLPCAYTDFATSPLPPAGNRLPVAVEASRRHERAAD